MRAYVITSGTIFALIVAAHILRAIAEWSHVMHEPFFILMTISAAALSAWAFSVVRSAGRA